jgi:hypothetical protein
VDTSPNIRNRHQHPNKILPIVEIIDVRKETGKVREGKEIRGGYNIQPQQGQEGFISLK